MATKTLKPTSAGADQITMNTVSVTSATSQARSASAGASADRPGEGPVTPASGASPGFDSVAGPPQQDPARAAAVEATAGGQTHTAASGAADFAASGGGQEDAAAGAAAIGVAGMTGGQTNVGTVSGTVSGIAGAVGGPMRADGYIGSAMGVGAAMGLGGAAGMGALGIGAMGLGAGINYPIDPALSIYPRAAAQRGRGLHGQLVQQLGQMIVAGELGADRPLVPEEIGHRFEVSRTVVRESLRVLEAKGLVSARPNVGTRIRPVHEWNLLDPDVIEWRALGPYRGDQARELIELRQAFEPLAAHLVAGRAGRLPEPVRARLTELSELLPEAAATGDVAGYHRADAELHALLLRATDNRMLEHLAAVVCGALEITGVRSYSCSPEGESDQHTTLVDRILGGDGAGAAEVVSGLLRRSPGSAGNAHLPAQRDR